LRFCARADELFFAGDRDGRDAGLRDAARRTAGRALFFAAVLRATGAAARARV
jgi:hypothetical protein